VPCTLHAAQLCLRIARDAVYGDKCDHSESNVMQMIYSAYVLQNYHEHKEFQLLNKNAKEHFKLAGTSGGFPA
jgi:hypothetical protein